MPTCGDVVMIPIGLKGHMDPMIYVARALIKYGLTVTVVIQEDMRELVEIDIEGCNVELVPKVRVVGISWASENSKKALAPFLSKLLEDQQAGVKGPKCMIADMLQGWTQVWADKLWLPRYVLCPSPATFGLVMHSFSGLMAQGLLNGKAKDPEIRLSGAPILHLSDLPPMVPKNPAFLYENGDTFKESAGMLFNSMCELEPRAIGEFQAQVEVVSSPEKVTKMYPIGPMLPVEYFSEDTSEGSDNESEILQWLHTRPKASVLYVAFGSMAFLSPTDILELAHGLQTSGVSFLWILRAMPSNGKLLDGTQFLPPGFQAGTKDRGLVYTGFAPQLQILAHPSTGGFLTHCGWNSALESICKGVPMLAWPMNAEQGLNCRILVEETNVAIEIHKEADKSVKRGEVEKTVNLLMSGPVADELKKKVSELQRQARMAVAPGGSSHRNLESLVKEIQQSTMPPQLQ